MGGSVVDGSFVDGTQVAASLGATSQFDDLSGQAIWQGTFLGVNGEVMSSTSYSPVGAPSFQWVPSTTG